MLRIPKTGRIKIDMHRHIEGKIKTMTIKKEAENYYAIFTAIKEVEIPKVKDTNPIGIDMDIDSFITLSDKKKRQKPKFMKKKSKRIAHWQRITARRTKGSGNREKSKLKLQKEWQHINNQSDDYLHKTVNRLVNSDYTSFAVEGIHI